jgi:hypothetical protein
VIPHPGELVVPTGVLRATENIARTDHFPPFQKLAFMMD